MTEVWKQPVCEPCYGVMYPETDPERLPKEDFPDRCAICGRDTYSGIWLTPALNRNDGDYDEA